MRVGCSGGKGQLLQCRPNTFTVTSKYCICVSAFHMKISPCLLASCWLGQASCHQILCAGRRIFQEALAAGTMESFFELVEQFRSAPCVSGVVMSKAAVWRSSLNACNKHYHSAGAGHQDVLDQSEVKSIVQCWPAYCCCCEFASIQAVQYIHPHSPAYAQARQASWQLMMELGARPGQGVSKSDLVYVSKR